jgi:hypothetical protein
VDWRSGWQTLVNALRCTLFVNLYRYFLTDWGPGGVEPLIELMMKSPLTGTTVLMRPRIARGTLAITLRSYAGSVAGTRINCADKALGTWRL